MASETQFYSYRRERHCKHCGVAFTVTSKQANNRKYCSEACAKAARVKTRHAYYCNVERGHAHTPEKYAAYDEIHDIDSGYVTLAATVLQEISKEYEHILEAYAEEQDELCRMLERALALQREEQCLAQETEYLSALSLGTMDASTLFRTMHRRYGLERMDLGAEIRYMRWKSTYEVQKSVEKNRQKYLTLYMVCAKIGIVGN